MFCSVNLGKQLLLTNADCLSWAKLFPQLIPLGNKAAVTTKDINKTRCLKYVLLIDLYVASLVSRPDPVDFDGPVPDNHVVFFKEFVPMRETKLEGFDFLKPDGT